MTPQAALRALDNYVDDDDNPPEQINEALDILWQFVLTGKSNDH